MPISVDVLEERVDGMAATVAELKQTNEREHKEFRGWANRMPTWGTALVTLLSMIAGAYINQLIRG